MLCKRSWQIFENNEFLLALFGLYLELFLTENRAISVISYFCHLKGFTIAVFWMMTHEVKASPILSILLHSGVDFIKVKRCKTTLCSTLSFWEPFWDLRVKREIFWVIFQLYRETFWWNAIKTAKIFSGKSVFWFWFLNVQSWAFM